MHRRGDAGDGERDVAREAGGEVDCVGGEVDVTREKGDVFVCVEDVIPEESAGGYSVLEV